MAPAGSGPPVPAAVAWWVCQVWPWAAAMAVAAASGPLPSIVPSSGIDMSIPGAAAGTSTAPAQAPRRCARVDACSVIVQCSTVTALSVVMVVAAKVMALSFFGGRLGGPARLVRGPGWAAPAGATGARHRAPVAQATCSRPGRPGRWVAVPGRLWPDPVELLAALLMVVPAQAVRPRSRTDLDAGTRPGGAGAGDDGGAGAAQAPVATGVVFSIWRVWSSSPAAARCLRVPRRRGARRCGPSTVSPPARRPRRVRVRGARSGRGVPGPQSGLAFRAGTFDLASPGLDRG